MGNTHTNTFNGLQRHRILGVIIGVVRTLILAVIFVLLLLVLEDDLFDLLLDLLDLQLLGFVAVDYAQTERLSYVVYCEDTYFTVDVEIEVEIFILTKICATEGDLERVTVDECEVPPYGYLWVMMMYLNTLADPSLSFWI